MGDALRTLFSGVNGFGFVLSQLGFKVERVPAGGEAVCGRQLGVWGKVEGEEENEGLMTPDVARLVGEKREVLLAFFFSSFARSELSGSILSYFRAGWGDMFWRMDSYGLDGSGSVE